MQEIQILADASHGGGVGSKVLLIPGQEESALTRLRIRERQVHILQTRNDRMAVADLLVGDSDAQAQPPYQRSAEDGHHRNDC